jgi:hypothetical protein
MARSINEINTQILNAIASNDNLQELNTTSKVAIYRLLAYIVASAILLHEVIFEQHTKEINSTISTDKAHRASWYRKMALAFQFGFPLIPDTDQYNNTGYTEDQIKASKIIKYAAVTKAGGQILIKIATETAGVLAPINQAQKTAIDAYFEEIADCGVKYIVVNHFPDILLLNINIYRNPLVLTDTGMSIVYGNYPVQDAINEHMKALPFNGELVLAHLIDKLQQAEGVVIPHLVNAESQAIDINTNVYKDAVPINVKTIPESGYFTIPNFDNIRYVV